MINKEKLLEFVKEIIQKLLEGKIDSDEGDVLFKMNSDDQNPSSKSEGAAELSSEIKYLKIFWLVSKRARIV